VETFERRYDTHMWICMYSYMHAYIRTYIRIQKWSDYLRELSSAGMCTHTQMDMHAFISTYTNLHTIYMD